MPALWMDDWQAVPGLASASAQYRLAQTGVADDQRIAAWLAVPGRFPGDGTMAYRAYTQLARELFRRGDAERLDALAQDLASSAQTRSEPWQTLAHICTAAGAAVAGDPARLLDALRAVANLNLLDPGAAELALEALLKVSRGPAAACSPSLSATYGPMVASTRACAASRAARTSAAYCASICICPSSASASASSVSCASPCTNTSLS
jgi:hypothetical protein